MSIVLNLSEILLITIEYFMLIFLFWANYKIEFTKKKNIIVFVIILAEIILLEQPERLFLEKYMVIYPAVVLFIRILYQLNMKESLKLWGICTVLLSIPEMFIDYIYRMYLELNEEYDYFFVTIPVILGLIIFWFVRGRKRIHQLFLLKGKMYWAAIVLLLFIQAIISYFTYILSEIFLISKVRWRIGNYLVGIGIILIPMLIVVLANTYNDTKKKAQQIEDLEKLGEYQKEYFIRMLEKEEETKKFRHDITADLMQLMCYCNKKEYDKLQSYMKQMTAHIERINERYYDVGNEIVNAVINYHLSVPNSKEEVEVRGYLGSISEIEERDLCVIFSNLVQNAKEATQRLKEEEREILIEVKRGRNFIYGRIENTFPRKEK